MTAATLEAALIAHAPDAVLFVDCAGVIRLWNRGAETLFGYSAAEAVGHTLDLIVPEPLRAAHWAGFSRAVQQGHFTKDTVLQTSRALTKDGSSIAVELSAAIIWSPAGQVWGIMAIGRDVTERRAREQAQQERLARLEHQVAALTQGSTRAGDGSQARRKG
jgi:PAS domain S-box-containing protein